MKKITFLTKLFLVFLSVFLVSSFRRESNYCRLVDKIASQSSKELNRCYGLTLVGYGGGMMQDVKEVGGTYLSPESLSIERSREIYVNIIENYLDRINSNERLRPYLHNYPFEEKNLRFLLSTEAQKSKSKDDRQAVVLVFLAKGLLVYEGYDDQAEKYYEIYSEPYAEAVSIVKGK